MYMEKTCEVKNQNNDNNNKIKQVPSQNIIIFKTK